MQITTTLNRISIWFITHPTLARWVLIAVSVAATVMLALFTQDAAWACNPGGGSSCGGGG